MRILVTGATGFIASHLIPQLLQHGHAVGALCRRDVSAAEPLRPARLNALTQLAAAQKNLTLLPHASTEMETAVRAFAPKACVHLAGKSQVRESIEHPDWYQNANYGYTVALLQALAACGCRRVIHASSVMVYGKDAPLPYREDAIGSAPASPYGASKLASEVQLNTYARLGKLETVNLRLFSVYGPGLNPYTVPFLIANAILTQQPFTILGDGSSRRDYIDVADVVRAIELALQAEGSLPAVNIGTGVGTSLQELVRSIEQCLNKQAVLVYKPALAGELSLAIPDVSLARERLGFAAQTAIEAGLQRTMDWINKNSAN